MNRIDGYITDVSYPAFFYKEMQPVWLSSVVRFLGFSAPEAALPFTFCELGCGVGINLLVAAACHPNAHFVGIDFNEGHLEIARHAARSSGLRNIEFVHSGFTEFSNTNRTQFDFITTHGVWSWIAPKHQASLLACVNASLKTGGLFYLHYMCHPGSTDMIVAQQILNIFSHHIPGTSAQQVKVGLKLLQQLADRGVFIDRPAVRRHLDNLARMDSNHLAHEFLTDHWHPQHSADVHQQVGSEGLSYLGSADVFNNLDTSLSIPRNLQDVIRQTKAPALVETFKDLARNSHQRMDIFQRDPKLLSRADYSAQLSDITFRLLKKSPEKGLLSFSTPIGNIEGPEEIFSVLIQHLVAGPISFSDLSQLPEFSGKPALLLQSLQMMMLQEIIHPVKPAQTSVNIQTRALTQWFRQNGVALSVVDECGTAIGPSVDAEQSQRARID